MLTCIARAVACAAAGGIGLAASVAAFSGAVGKIALARLAASGVDFRDLEEIGKEAIKSAVNE